jgi:site-specific DNA-methyltransferase (adenine-specific)
LNELNQIILADCMDIMRGIPDKYFELAVVDPPYGNHDAIGIVNSNGHKAHRKNYKKFDNIPPDENYFAELKRISHHQIIWGGNWFGLRGGYFCWNKEGTAFGEAELAYCSMFNSVRIYKYTWNGMIQENMSDKEIRIHPTQKPVALYRWLLQNYAKPGDKIIDTHSGSGSCAIACFLEHYEFLAIEKDADYHAASVQRLDEIRAQGRLF